MKDNCVDHTQLTINKKYVPRKVFFFTICKLKEWILLILQGRCRGLELHPAVGVSIKDLICRGTKKLLVAPIQVKREVSILKIRPDFWGANSRYPYHSMCRTAGSGRIVPCQSDRALQSKLLPSLQSCIPMSLLEHGHVLPWPYPCPHSALPPCCKAHLHHPGHGSSFPARKFLCCQPSEPAFLRIR